MSPLATATAVQSLSLGGTDLVQPTDLSLLAGLTAVHGMVLYYATPATLQPLSSMHDLTSLQLGHVTLGANGIAGIEALPLNLLMVEDSDLADLSLIAGMTGLSFLYLDHDQYTDISPLLTNSGLGANDYIYLNSTSYDCTAQASNLQQLKATGATVSSACL